MQEALFEEFDFSKLDQEMKTLFPDEKLSFREILMQLISGKRRIHSWYSGAVYKRNSFLPVRHE